MNLKEHGKDWSSIDFKGVGNHVHQEIQKILGIIFALNKLEVDYKSTKEFNRFRRALIEAFGSG